ncbi:Asp23/Gls24 family envelope stress response protein [Streptomyces sp. NRRL B-3648]|uniref:Asp23/Gls24 family envelope stress response protein n=1 Tax=Streptomyces sp. NRRL B-3648 TaxID=1519493 RepID=UPI0006AF6FE2|nr:Asp23/Gls24 family envelope stress response protein [Streptomyces sp. NRRL B-3648]
MALDDSHARPPEPPAAEGLPFEGDQVLPCGRLLSRVWEQACDAAPAADPHTVSCPHCHEAVEGLATVNAATGALRAEDAPGLRALADRVMNIVRAEARLGRLLPLADPDRDLRIAESAAAKVLRQAADTVPGVRAAGCRLTPAAEGTDVRVTMNLAAALDRPLTDRVHQVRGSVLHSAGQILGLAVTAVDITVVDVLEPEPPLGRPGLPTGGGA